MSLKDAERFANDLKAKPQLLQELKKTAAGMGLAGVCQFAKEKGYTVTVDEAKSYIRGKAKSELNDQQLDRIAGGKGGTTVVNITNYSLNSTNSPNFAGQPSVNNINIDLSVPVATAAIVIT